MKVLGSSATRQVTPGRIVGLWRRNAASSLSESGSVMSRIRQASNRASLPFLPDRRAQEVLEERHELRVRLLRRRVPLSLRQPHALLEAEEAVHRNGMI